MVETYTPSLMQLTDGAVNKILSLKSEESESEILNLRVYVTGCLLYTSPSPRD